MKYNLLNEDFFNDIEDVNDENDNIQDDNVNIQDYYDIYDAQMVFQFNFEFNKNKDISKFADSIQLQNILKQFIRFIVSLSFIKDEEIIFSVYSLPLFISCKNDIDKISKYNIQVSSGQFMNNPQIINDKINYIIEETLKLDIVLDTVSIYISTIVMFNPVKIPLKRYDRLANEFMGLCSVWKKISELAWNIGEQPKSNTRFLYKRNNTKIKDINYLINIPITDKFSSFIIERFFRDLMGWEQLNTYHEYYNCPAGIKKVIKTLCIDKSVYDMSLMGYYQDDNDRGVSIMIVFKYNGFKDEKNNTTKAISKYITNILNNLNEYQMGSIIRLTVNVEFYFICDKQTLPVSEHKFDYENYKQTSKYFVKLRTNKQEYNNNIHFSVFFLDEYYRLYPDSYCKDRYARYEDIIKMTKKHFWEQNTNVWMQLTNGNCIV